MGALLTDNKTIYDILYPEIQIDGKLKFRHFEVIPETVGQFTGFSDNNGIEIYEGDILEFITQRKYGFQYDGGKVRFKVEFGKFNPLNDTLYDFIGFHANGGSIQYKLHYGCVIIGNIHDNPELINLNTEKK